MSTTDGGSITPEMHSVMSKLEDKGLLQIHEFTEVEYIHRLHRAVYDVDFHIVHDLTLDPQNDDWLAIKLITYLKSSKFSAKRYDVV